MGAEGGAAETLQGTADGRVRRRAGGDGGHEKHFCAEQGDQGLTVIRAAGEDPVPGRGLGHGASKWNLW